MRKSSFIILALIFVIVLTSCGMGTSGGQVIPTATKNTAALPTQPEQVQPTENVQPAQPQMPTLEPTSETEFTFEPFYTEDFVEGSPSITGWGDFPSSDDSGDWYLENGKLWAELKKENWWYIYIYQPYTYEDVAMTINVENRGKSSNAAFLVCRYQRGVGRYEFEIRANGLYEVRDVHYEMTSRHGIWLPTAAPARSRPAMPPTSTKSFAKIRIWNCTSMAAWSGMGRFPHPCRNIWKAMSALASQQMSAPCLPRWVLTG